MSNQHLCMFIRSDNEQGFVQCTIKPEHKKAFFDLGFVDNIEYLPAPKRKRVKKVSEKEELC